MKNWIIILVIIVVLFTLSLCEYRIIDGFCNKIEKLADTAIEKTLSQIGADNEVDEMIKVWNQSKEVVYVFLNHNIYSSINEILVTSSTLLNMNKYDEAYIQFVALKKENDKLREYLRCSIGNVF